MTTTELGKGREMEDVGELALNVGKSEKAS